MWYDDAYRLPLPSFEAMVGAELRRADFVAWYLADSGLVAPDELKRPERVSYRDLARVHTLPFLGSTNAPETLARVFACTPEEIKVAAVLKSVRLACGGTLAAAREARVRRTAVLNLGGGFHHAEPDRAGGYCLLNDVAVAAKVLRAEGFVGKICVIDLDAHPPDGTAACLQDDPDVWIGSISGADWGPLPPEVDETCIPGADNRTYLKALEELLRRMPRPAFAFVLAGGDVLDRDHHGGLKLTIPGVRARDELVAAAVEGVGSVWVPAGGYHADAWRVLANTALVLARSPVPDVPPTYDPLDRRFSFIARTLRRESLTDRDEIDLDDIAADLRLAPRKRDRLFDFYTEEGLELVFEQYGILEHLRRLGYEDFRVEVSNDPSGERVRLFGHARGMEHLLIEVVVERRKIGASGASAVSRRDEVVYVHWLTLRNPLAHFDEKHPGLPGQEVRGLGLAREISGLLGRMAARLELAGVAFTPSHYHMAYAARAHCRFIDPERQGRFEAMLRDLGNRPLAEVTRAVAEGRVRLDGRPYTWEAVDMVYWLEPRSADEETVRAEAERSHFSIEPAGASA